MFVQAFCLIALSALVGATILPPAVDIYLNETFSPLSPGGGLAFWERQVGYCQDPGYVECVNIPNKCCPPGDNCRIDLQACCPPNAQTCGGTVCWKPGVLCCPNGVACAADNPCCLGGCCNRGTTCCPAASNCCTAGAECCPGICCPPGYTCGSTVGSCRPLITTTEEPTTTSSSSSSSVTSTPKSSSPAPITTPKPKTPTESSTSIKSTSTNSCPTPNPSPGASQIASLPTVEFLYVPSDYEFLNDIVLSVCLGFQARGIKGNFDILTRAEGSGKCYDERRKNGKCRGCCTGVYKDNGPYQFGPRGGRTKTSCDEYPFASTAEGGDGAHRSCVVDWQNSYQGNELKRFYGANGVKVGDSFGVRVVGVDCDTVKETDLQACGGARTVKRQSRAGVLASGTSNWVIPAAAGTNASNVLVISFGDLESGSYSSYAKLLEGEVDELSIVSNSGNVLAMAPTLEELRTAGKNMDFDFDEAEYGVGILALTKQKTMNMSYELSSDTAVTTSESPSSTGSAATASSSKPSEGIITKVNHVFYVATCLVVLYLVLL